MTREEKIKFCLESALEVGDTDYDCENLPDDQLDDIVEWFKHIKSKNINFHHTSTEW